LLKKGIAIKVTISNPKEEVLGYFLLSQSIRANYTIE
jgi:hypothetical protein